MGAAQSHGPGPPQQPPPDPYSHPSQRSRPHGYTAGAPPGAYPQHPNTFQGQPGAYPPQGQGQRQGQGQGGMGHTGGRGGPGGGPRLSASPSMQFQQKYGFIPDQFTSLQQVQDKLREVGLESSNLILGVDFTKSNEWTGKHSFQGRSLHAVGSVANPYEEAISIIGQTLAPFDEDDLIPCFGFGDVSTHDNAVFDFYPEGRPCDGFTDVLQRYRTILPHVKLSGPTSFAPIIEAAIRVVEQSGGQYHVLVIIADGQVTRSVDLEPAEQSPQEKATVDAICAASNYPLSIVLVGVGDGPWDTMERFDDLLPNRNFDNFQFVNLTQIMSSHGTREQLAAKFAVMSLMEVSQQYRACTEMGIVGRRLGRMPAKAPLPPPPQVLAADAQRAAGVPHAAPGMGVPQASFSSPSAPIAGAFGAKGAGGADAGARDVANECPVCFQASKSMAFQCGHQTCIECGSQMQLCPLCRVPVTLRIKLYS